MDLSADECSVHVSFISAQGEQGESLSVIVVALESASSLSYPPPLSVSHTFR